MLPPLTKRQRDVLQAFAAWQSENGLAPTLEELGQALGVNRVTVYGHVVALIQKGYLENLMPNASRGLDLTEDARSSLFTEPSTDEGNPSPPAGASFAGAAPLPSFQILGRIAAGQPLEAVESPEPFVVDELFDTRRNLYLLEVEGDSMIEDHIQAGDLVLVDRDRPAENGDIVVAILEDGEATLKRFFRESDGRFRLQPANARLRPRIVEHLEIRGVVTGVVRRF